MQPARGIGALIVGVATLAPPTLGQGFGGPGVLVRPPETLFCFLLETDAGEVFLLDDYGGFAAGDRVVAEGDALDVGVCDGFIFSRIRSNRIDAAFAGTGVLEATARPDRRLLRTEDGRRIGLPAVAGFEPGDAVFVRGRARTIDTAGGPRTVVPDPIVGAAFADFGHYRGPTADGFLLELADGSEVVLEQPGPYDLEVDDYLFVEGALVVVEGELPRLAHNTARRALQHLGTLVDDPDLGVAFAAQGIAFDDRFVLLDTAGFDVGATVFVRGRRLDDYDPGERTAEPIVRGARVDAGFGSCGVRSTDPPPDFVADDGTEVLLGDRPALPADTSIYVAGAIAESDGATIALEHHVAFPCLDVCGPLELGFECAPLLSAPEGVFFVEELGGFGIGDFVRVRGAVGSCEAACPFACIFANTISTCDASP